MAFVLAVIFVVIPILEIAVIVLVADYIGGLETVALLIALSMIGAVLAKREGIGVWCSSPYSWLCDRLAWFVLACSV